VDAVQASGNDVKTIQFGGWPGDSRAHVRTNDPVETKRSGSCGDSFQPDRWSERGASRRPPN
jgi:hypothetical protein